MAKNMTIAAAASVMAKVGKGMANPLREQIVAMLRRAPANVSAIAESLQIDQPLATYHLNILKTSGVVGAVRQGKSVVHWLKFETFESLGPVQKLLGNKPKNYKIPDARRGTVNTTDEAETIETTEDTTATAETEAPAETPEA